MFRNWKIGQTLQVTSVSKYVHYFAFWDQGYKIQTVEGKVLAPSLKCLLLLLFWEKMNMGSTV